MFLDLESVIPVWNQGQSSLSLAIYDESVAFQANSKRPARNIVAAFEPFEIFRIGEPGVRPHREHDRLQAGLKRDRDAIDIALDVLKQLSRQGITAEQLASVKAYIKGTFPTQQLETTDQLSNILADMELYGLGKDEIDDFFSRIDAPSLDEINATARKYYKPDHLTFVLLGNAAKIRQVAAKYAPKVTEVSVNKPGFSAE